MFDRFPGFFQKDAGGSLFDDGVDFQSLKVDVKEKKDHYVIDAELPGFTKDDIVVEYKDNYLTIRGKKEETVERKEDDGRFVRRERSYGTVQRRFYAGDIDEKKIKGTFKNGLLTLTVPKSGEELDRPSGYRIDLK